MSHLRSAGFTVAVDGPAAAGKGTVARALAEEFGFAFLDTGLLYRSVARRVIEIEGRGGKADPVVIARTLQPEDLEAGGLRTREVSAMSSVIAVIEDVREALLAFQRAFAGQPGGAVLDGRDIGTVICPDADVKLYITADAETRAQRRYDELVSAGNAVDPAEVLTDLRIRDERDRTRGLAALRIAEDAILIDTTELTISMAVDRAIAAVKSRMKSD
ncbi:MAG: (d)CMP kinase [Rhodobacteraceae bacterium]|nr:(d)CMP kinase [Paracoccaceae bacterium]